MYVLTCAEFAGAEGQVGNERGRGGTFGRMKTRSSCRSTDTLLDHGKATATEDKGKRGGGWG